MTGYVRKDTTNNIADGNVINAADLDAEFDGVQDAFNASTGHKHDGTAGEGATINALGPTQDVTISSTLLAPKTTNTVDIGSSSLKFKDLFLAGNASVGGTLAVTGVATLTAQPILSSLTASRAVFTDGSKGLVSNAITGTGNVVMSASPTLTGTAGFENITASGTLGVTGVATFTAQPIVSSLTASRAVFSDGSKGLVSNAITGTGNVVMSASPTLTGTIAAEALTASSSVTLSGGTANGVTYLNGSKVLTTGSVLTFDGTRLTSTTGKFGFGAASNSASLMVNNATNTATGIQLFQDGIESWIMGMPANSAGLAWSASGSEQMRLTSTGLGIGTSSPASLTKLTVFQDSTYAVQLMNSSQNYTLRVDAGASNALILGNRTSFTDLLAISTSGNLGIGTSSPAYKLDVAGPVQSSAGYYINGNTSGGYIWVRDNYALRFGTNDTERMRLDSAGNLGLGVTPSSTIWSGDETRLVVKGNSASKAGVLALQSQGTTNATTAFFVAEDLRAGASLGTSTNSFLAFQTNGSERARIDTSGNLGIGTSSPATRLSVDNTRSDTAGTGWFTYTNVAVTGGKRGMRVDTNNAYWFDYYNGSSWSAQMGLDSAGNLLVGTTTAQTGVVGDAVGITLYGPTATGTGVFTRNGIPLYVNNKNSSGGLIQFYGNGNIIGDISSSGTTTSYNTSSDYRLKNTIAPMTGALAKVALLKPVTYKWNADGSDGEGFIAHELAEVCPHAVTGEKDAVDEEGNPKYQGIDTSFLVATLTAAIQELKAEFDAYKASHP